MPLSLRDLRTQKARQISYSPQDALLCLFVLGSRSPFTSKFCVQSSSVGPVGPLIGASIMEDAFSMVVKMIEIVLPYDSMAVSVVQTWAAPVMLLVFGEPILLGAHNGLRSMHWKWPYCQLLYWWVKHQTGIFYGNAVTSYQGTPLSPKSQVQENGAFTYFKWCCNTIHGYWPRTLELC